MGERFSQRLSSEVGAKLPGSVLLLESRPNGCNMLHATLLDHVATC